MRSFLAFLFLFFYMLCCVVIIAQDAASVPTRTPEQEAVLQTQKMQKELQLNAEQQQTIYEINLKYARERQVSNSRTQALERTRNKNSAIKQVLTHEQYDQLQNKRYPTKSNIYINRTLPQQRQNPPSLKRADPVPVTPKINNEVTRTPSRTTPTNPAIRNNPASAPTRDRTIVRPPSNGTDSNERTKRR